MRCYYPDAKIVRVEPRTFRNAFPSLSPQQQKSLAAVLRFPQGRAASASPASTPQVVGVRAEGRPALRPQVLGRRRDRPPAEGAHDQRARRGRRAVRVHRRHDRRQDRPRDGRAVVADGAARLAGAADRAPAKSTPHETGWIVTRVPPGFAQDRRRLPHAARASASRSRTSSTPTASSPSRVRRADRRGAAPLGLHRSKAASTSTACSSDDYLVTVLGEVPAATVRQIAQFGRAPLSRRARHPYRFPRLTVSHEEARHDVRTQRPSLRRARRSLRCVARRPGRRRRAGAGAGAGRRGRAARLHRALREAGPGGGVDRRHAEGQARARHAGAVRGRSVLRILPPLRPDSAPARRARARVRAAVGRLRLHHLGRRLHRHQRARRRRRRRSHRQARPTSASSRPRSSAPTSAPTSRCSRSRRRTCRRSRSAIPTS